MFHIICEVGAEIKESIYCRSTLTWLRFIKCYFPCFWCISMCSVHISNFIMFFFFAVHMPVHTNQYLPWTPRLEMVTDSLNSFSKSTFQFKWSSWAISHFTFGSYVCSCSGALESSYIPFKSKNVLHWPSSSLNFLCSILRFLWEAICRGEFSSLSPAVATTISSLKYCYHRSIPKPEAKGIDMSEP